MTLASNAEITGLRQIALTVSDVARSTAFYRDAVGLRLVPDKSSRGWVEFEDLALHAIPDFHEFLPLPPLDPKDELSKKVHGFHREAAALAKTVGESSGKWRFGVKDFGNPDAHAINGGDRDTPWLVELRPRWAVLPDNVEEELSKHRHDLSQSRIREEQSLYPEGTYPRAGLESPNQRSAATGEQDRIERTLPPPLPPAVRSRIAAAQTDSVYIAKPWRQVRGLDSLGEFAEDFRRELSPNPVEDPTGEVGTSLATSKELDQKDTKFQMKWLPLLPQFWQELPWQNGTSTTLRDVDRDLQVALTTDADKMRRVLAANRKLLEAYFPDTIKPRTEKYSYMLLERDQIVRWSWFCWSLGCFLVLGLVLDLNATSWHGYYAERIASAWIQPAAGLDRQIPLGQLRTVEEGLPYHLISGSLNSFGHSIDDADPESLNPRKPPVGTAVPTDLFLLSQLFAGSKSTGYRAIRELQDDNYNLASAVAVSGGAVNPLHAQNPLQKALLLLANVRLGQWIQNPGYGRRRWKVLEKILDNWPITPFRFFATLAWPLDRWKYCFVTDGGLTENLGIKQLLLRRCKLILAVDAGQDEKFQFHDLSKLLRWMQVDQGIRVTWQSATDEVKIRAKELKLSPDNLSPVMCTARDEKSAAARDKPAGRPLNPDAAQHHLLARIEYPGYADAPAAEREKFVGYLVYMKSTLCQNDPEELVSHQQAHPQFPHDPTSDFAFDRDQFESYRRLGEHTVDSTLKGILGSTIDPIATAFLAAVRQASGLSCEAEAVASGTPGQVTDSIAPVPPTTPAVSAAETMPAAQAPIAAAKASEPVQNPSTMAAAGSAASPSSGASNSVPDPDQYLKDALKHGDLMSRKKAVLSLKGFPEHQRQLIKDLVKQLGDASGAEVEEVHSLLIDLHDKPLLWLCDSFELQRVDCQVRSVRVIGDILLDHCDLPTLRELCRWLKKDDVRERVKHEIRHALRRIPLDGYSADEMLTEVVSLALHSN